MNYSYAFGNRNLSLRSFINKSVSVVEELRPIVAPRKFDVLKTNVCPKSEASRANMLV